MMKKISYVGAGIITALAVPFLVFADTFSTSTAPTLVNGFIADIAVIIGAVIAGILGIYAGLVGLGWGIRKFKHYVSGRKF